MKTDIVFENLKVGQEIYSLQFGKGVVEELNPKEVYSIRCKFIDSDGDVTKQTFNQNGKYANYNALPTLFLTNPFENLNEERVIEVLIGNKWNKRVCIKVVNGWAICWDGAETIEKSKNRLFTNSWDTWRELQPEQPAVEQPKEITIDGVEYTLTPKTK